MDSSGYFVLFYLTLHFGFIFYFAPFLSSFCIDNPTQFTDMDNVYT